MVSFDVVSLFTKIPNLEALDLISKLVDPEILNLIKICHTSTFFTFKGTCFEQTKGTTNGSLLSQIVVANTFIKHFEDATLKSFHQKPKCWYRFVDDNFVVWIHVHPTLNSFEHLNNISPHIQFTMEIQTNNSNFS